VNKVVRVSYIYLTLPTFWDQFLEKKTLINMIELISLYLVV